MILLFFVLLFILFLVSRVLTSELSVLFQRVFKSHKLTIFLIAAIFLPGTLIHEFSHAIMAGLMFVHVGHMELWPKIEGNSLKLGSVEVGKTDIIRNFFIGVAPFVIGTSLLLGVLYYSFSNNLIGFNVITILILFLVFVIANTMYSSRKDMEGAIEFFILVGVPIAFLYFLGVRIPGLSFETLRSDAVEDFFRISSIYLLVPLILDISIILFSKIVIKR